jgi:hypothetical protein
MKYHTIALVTLASVAAGSLSVHAAAPTAELKVKGELDAPTCTVSIGADKSGVVDLGKISPTLIKPSAVTAITPNDVPLKAVCSAETYLNFTIIDNRESSVSAPGTQRFGLGLVNGNGKLGYYEIAMGSAGVDGKTSSVFSSATGSFSPVSTVKLTKGMRNGWSSGTSNQQALGKEFTALLSVQPYLASSADMGGTINDKVTLDGSATLNFAFGI